MSPPGEGLVAVNVLLKPDAAARRQALVLNAALRADLPSGFAFDRTHEPHITLLQLFVAAGRLEQVAAAAASLVADHGGLRLRAVGLGSGPLGTPPGIELMGVEIERGGPVQDLQAAARDALLAFRESGGTADAFFRRQGEAPVNAATVAYVERFIAESSGERFTPHMTVGVGRVDLIKRLAAEGFVPFVIEPPALALYRLGDLGTARQEIGCWTF